MKLEHAELLAKLDKLEVDINELRTAERIKGAHDELTAWYSSLTRRGRKLADQRLRTLERLARQLSAKTPDGP